MRSVLCAILLLATLNGLRSAEHDLELFLEVRPGRGDKPMVVLWIEGTGFILHLLRTLRFVITDNG